MSVPFFIYLIFLVGNLSSICTHFYLGFFVLLMFPFFKLCDVISYGLIRLPAQVFKRSQTFL